MSDSLTIQNVGKCYPVYRSNFHRFGRWVGISSKPKTEFWANKDINVTLGRGQTLGVIGQNGAGKSTLLKLITGTIRPTTGQISVNGRVSAILELGIGFNPDFTGRENIYHSGGLMGYPNKEIDELIPHIIDFAEIGAFFDLPTRVYSSGMMARLAFSLATAVQPDVLIVDEVLSVGDSYFQHKSFDRIRQFRENGASIILVSHSMGTIRELADRVILMDDGKIRKDGKPDEVVDYYNALMSEKENANLTITQRRQKDGWLHTEYGNRMAVMKSMQLRKTNSNQSIILVESGEQLIVESEIEIIESIDELVVGHRISDPKGHIVWGTNTWHSNQNLRDLKPGTIVKTKLEFKCDLGPGSYSVSFGLHRGSTHVENCYHRADNQIVFDVVNSSDKFFIGSNNLDAEFQVTQQ